jgi:transcriptional regulator with XRE-family HTH domain
LGDFADKIGKGLREARRARGLTLRQVSALTDGRFKATSVAGYERGERTISVERFCELCGLYGVAPQAVLGEIVRAVDERTEPLIDLTKLEAMGAAERTLVGGFVRRIQAQRGEPPAETIVLRDVDLDVLASASGKTRDELAEALEPADRRRIDGPTQTPRR